MFKRDLELERKWERLMRQFESRIGRRPKDMHGVLFLIGVQELGKGKRNFTKEEKQDLLHIAICKVMSYAGYYVLEGTDQEGWPHWKMVKKLPHFDLVEQEKVLKLQVMEYFQREHHWDIEEPH